MQPLVPGRGVLGARPAWLMLCRRSPSTVQWQGFHDLSFSLTVMHPALGVRAVLGHPCLGRGFSFEASRRWIARAGELVTGAARRLGAVSRPTGLDR